MNKLLLIGTVLLLSTVLTCQAQEEKEKLTREQKKEMREQREQERIQVTKQALNDTLYVLEADYLGNRQGQRVSVSSTINFISVTKDKAVFQFGSAHTIGYNGVGGATVEGSITKYEITERKNGGSYFVRINISSTIGFFDITLDIGASGNTSATVHTNTRHKLNYSGKLMPRSESSIFKGMSY